MRAFRILLFFAISGCPAGLWAQGKIGIFDDHGDVGTVLHRGSVDYDGAHKIYTIAGSGENMWLAQDAFQFVWKKVSDDVMLTADISFLTKTGNEHKKAVLMLRQSLDADSVYADVALHASGLTSLQFRDEKGAITRQIQSNLSAPKRLRISKRGDYVYMALGDQGELQPRGGWLRIPLAGSFYVGLGVCSHDPEAIETAVFSNVELTQPPPANGQPVLYSTLENIAVSAPTSDRRAVYVAQGRFEAPNWTRDASAFLFNREGRMERLAVGSDKTTIIDTGFANRCNNDHGISPDSTQLAISDNSQGDHQSLVYLVPITGGTPRRITQKSPSYWHGWSPDGKTLAFVGYRSGEFDIYSIPAAGGEETRLTTAKGLDDGPEYSADGNSIYFNSERTGHMQIWRMKPDGSQQEQVFSDDLNNWFPHISPDGQWMVFLTYAADVTGHPENKDVMLRLMSLADKKITVLARLFGGQGTINVPSWSPDSKQVAFVSYMLIPPENNPESFCCLERRGRQALAVVKIAGGIVGPGIARGNRIGHRRAGNDHGRSVDFCVGGYVLAIWAGNLKASNPTAAFGREPIGVIEPHAQRMILPRQLTIQRSGPLQLFSISDRQRGPGQTKTHVQLVLRVNVGRIADIDGYCHSSIPQRQRFSLGLANFGPAAVRPGRPVRDLYKQEREIALIPRLPPVFDHGLKQTRVQWSSLPAVRFALIPDHAANGKPRQGRDHSVV